MNYCTLQGEINGDLFELFMKEVKDFNQDEPITIYLDSEGGELGTAEAIIDFIDNWKHDVTIVAVNFIQSAAFDIFIRSNSIKRVSCSVVAGIHIGDSLASLCDLRTKVKGYKQTENQFNYTVVNFNRVLKAIGVSDDIIEFINETGDTYNFTQPELAKLADKAMTLYYHTKENQNGN